jgi:hypothetical protein
MISARDDLESWENLATIRNQDIAMIFKFDQINAAGSEEAQTIRERQ